MPEITEQQLAGFQKAMTLLDKLTGDPKTGLSTQRKLKEIDPSLNFPGIDVGDVVVQPIKDELTKTQETLQKLQDERAAEKEAAANAALEGKLRDSIGKAQSKYKLTDEGVHGLVKFMQERQVADAELAAPAYLETLPKAPAPIKPSPFAPQHANLFGTGDDRGSDENIKSLHDDPVRWFDREVASILAEDAA